MKKKPILIGAAALVVVAAVSGMALRGRGEKVVVGPDLAGGQTVQLFIPGGTFHTARVIGTRQWFLGASTEWPGVIPADVELGDAGKLAVAFPAVAGEIAAFPKAG